jgi:hypothetical protein
MHFFVAHEKSKYRVGSDDRFDLMMMNENEILCVCEREKKSIAN